MPADFGEVARGFFRKHTDYKKTIRFSQIAVCAAGLALEDAKLSVSPEESHRIGVCQGTGIGGLLFTEHQAIRFHQDKGVDPLGVVKLMPNVVSASITLNYQIKGPSLTVTTACASGAHAIGIASDWIKSGRIDWAIVGGVETPLSPLALIGFNHLGALAIPTSTPEKASCPFDKNRNGFVLAEGGAMLILESRRHLDSRGGNAYCQFSGWNLNSEAHHWVMPLETGDGMAITMKGALQDAHLDPSEIDYINAHGTSTPLNDRCETLAIKKVFDQHSYNLKINSTKSMIGHSIGASGAIEAAVTALSLFHQKLHPTRNLITPDPDCDLNYLPVVPDSVILNHALCNSFGFGGNNACLVLSR